MKAKKRIIFFDGDGTLWYPETTKREKVPFWIYNDESTKDQYLDHLVVTPQAVESLTLLREHGVKTVILSTHPHEPEEAARVLGEKVSYFKLGELFDEIHATAERREAKGEKILEVLNRLGIPKNQALMVGDSYRWDYLPARSVGVDALLLESQYRRDDRHSRRVTKVINELDDLPRLLLEQALAL